VVPTMAPTVGVATIFDAKEVLFLVTGVGHALARVQHATPISCYETSVGAPR